jgi:hypothetical protein
MLAELGDTPAGARRGPGSGHSAVDGDSSTRSKPRLFFLPSTLHQGPVHPIVEAARPPSLSRLLASVRTSSLGDRWGAGRNSGQRLHDRLCRSPIDGLVGTADRDDDDDDVLHGLRQYTQER